MSWSDIRMIIRSANIGKYDKTRAVKCEGNRWFLRLSNKTARKKYYWSTGSGRKAVTHGIFS